ncbi:MAG: malectin domain-containing carbohydrate-binding protein [Granulosicoccus sp.]
MENRNKARKGKSQRSQVALAVFSATILGLGVVANASEQDNSNQQVLNPGDIAAHDWHTGAPKDFVSRANPVSMEHPGGDPDYLVDGDRIYVYTSTDANQAYYKRYPDSNNGTLFNQTYLDMDGYTVWSSEDMIHWRNHGVQFAAMNLDAAKWREAYRNSIAIPDLKESFLEQDVSPHAMWAPTAAKYTDENGDSTYVLYYPKGIDGVGKFTTGYATAPNPYGPFTDQGPLYGDIVDENDPNRVERVVIGMDPNVFIDGDKIYIYGNGDAGRDELDNTGQVVVAELSEFDHINKKQTIITKPQRLEYDMNNTMYGHVAGNKPLSKDFHEGGSMHKSNGKYYFSWAEHEHKHYKGWYSMCNSPVGPCEWIGPTIKGTYQGNQHGSFAEFKGQEYYLSHLNHHADVVSQWDGWQSYRRTWTINPVTYNADKSIRVMYPEASPIPNINVGGAFTDGNGLSYVDSTQYVSDGGYASVNNEVGGLEKLQAANPDTSNLKAYEGNRVGQALGTLDVNVPGLENGEYDVTLKFAEIFPDAQVGTDAGWFSRIMNISAQGQQLVTGLDVMRKAGGAYRAYDQRLSAVKVTDTTLRIAITATKGEPMLSAVEITAAPKPGWALNLGGVGTSVNGVTFDVDPGVGNFNDNTSEVITLDPAKVIGANADEQDLFASSRIGWAGLNYSNTTLANGNYDVTLGFVETHHVEEGSRLFDVEIQGELVLDDFDIFKAAGGKNIAVKRVFPTTVTEGKLNIDLTTVTDASRISFIKVVRTADARPDSSIRINAGNFWENSDTGGAYFLADEPFLGQGGSPMVGTSDAAVTREDERYNGLRVVTPTDEVIYQTGRWGNSFGYTVPVRNGRYSVRLMFAEDYHSAAGKRVFEILLNGEKQIVDLAGSTQFDIFRAAGGKNKAIDLVYDVDVNNQVLNIDLQASIDNASISGIVITPRYLEDNDGAIPSDPNKWEPGYQPNSL